MSKCTQHLGERRGGFDVVLGNPPFVGGLKISELYGNRVRHLLNNAFTDVQGKADLCSLMFRRAFDVLNADGRAGMVATNTICQGQTRETGLAQILRCGGRIAWAQRYVTWPGTANVEVNLIAITAASTLRHGVLDGALVSSISSRLDALPESEPAQLSENRRLCFQGSIVLGKGFILDPDEAVAIINSDAAYAECLFPYLTGEDINTDPSHEPSRWIIQFDERSADQARQYERLWDIGVERILPERQNKDAVRYPRMVHEWWKHWNNRQELYEKVRPLKRAIARSRVSEFHMLAWVRTDIIYSDACVVFVLDDDLSFGVLQSGIHEVWLRREASTMRTDIRYTPTDCFSTYPLPCVASSLTRQEAVNCSRRLYNSRQEVMAERSIGFTQLYNAIHDAGCIDSCISGLRDRISALDSAVLALYDWTDIPADRDFEIDERGRSRFVLARATRESLVRRLAALNLERAKP